MYLVPEIGKSEKPGVEIWKYRRARVLSNIFRKFAQFFTVFEYIVK